ncbi:hypothetical protein J2Y69_002262 [Microbacterium resistens]|uniref:DUF4326 domain-containing protein n=1 Tax=Microbacterium resistens TaxID=156977 RepID=A0ABU1SDH3_9MICO|nr:hypothetical protein [Microbacterium resistens]
MPSNTVSVARPTKWGNPFRIEQVECSVGGLCWAVSIGNLGVQQHIVSQAKARDLAVYLFQSWMEEDDRHGLPDPSPLAGKNLACWCPLDQPCHADVLLELANGGAR